MRWPIIKSVFGKEMTELLRNRRSLAVMFGVPLVLYPLLTIAVASLAEGKEQEMTQRQWNVAVVNPAGAPHLLEMLAEPDAHMKRVDPAPGNLPQAMHLGAIDAAIVIPANYEAEQTAQLHPPATQPDDEDQLKLELDQSREVTLAVEPKLQKLLDRYQQWIVEQRLITRNVPAQLAQAPQHIVIDLATGNQNFGLILSRMLPVLLLLTGMLGSLYPALSATTTERELGTMETLLVTPATRNELLTAKAGIVLLSGLLTALLNMISMSLVLWRVLSQVQNSKLTAGFSIDPRALALSYLAAVPTLIFFTALVLMVGLLARNLREANAYATPIMLIPIASMLIGIADPATTPALLVTPVANTTVIIKDVLTGQAHVGAFALAFVSSCIYAGLVLSLAGRVFTNEQLVNPEWEPISLRGLSRRKNAPPRYPAVDEVIGLFAVTVLLNFYASPSFVRFGLLPLLCVVELGAIALPTALLALLARYRWREVFSLRSAPPRAFAGALLLAIGLLPVVSAISALQSYFHILPGSRADAEGMARLFGPAIKAHPFLLPIAIGLLAGVCEEFLFRGPIQSALVRRLPVGLALSTGALLFAGAHMDASGMPIRFGLGFLLGWLVLETGSIFPSMLLHGAYDCAAAALMSHTSTDATFSRGDVWFLLLGVIFCAIGLFLVRRRLSVIAT